MLRWIFSTLSRLARTQADDTDTWPPNISRAERYLSEAKLAKAEKILRPLSVLPLPDDRRLHTLYILGIVLGRQGKDREASTCLEEAFQLTQALCPDDTGRLVSTLQNWLLSLEDIGEEEKVAYAEAQLRILGDKLRSELWTYDAGSNDWIHIATTIRFPESFGALHRIDVRFDNAAARDGQAIYALRPPGRGKVIVDVCITDKSPKEGLIELSDRAVAMLGLDGADYREGSFRVGLETARTGVRRLWPFFDVEGENWNLETFFAVRGQVHICIFKTCPPGDVIETGESIEKMLVQFDWPAPE